MTGTPSGSLRSPCWLAIGCATTACPVSSTRMSGRPGGLGQCPGVAWDSAPLSPWRCRANPGAAQAIPQVQQQPHCAVLECLRRITWRQAIDSGSEGGPRGWPPPPWLGQHPRRTPGSVADASAMWRRDGRGSASPAPLPDRPMLAARPLQRHGRAGRFRVQLSARAPRRVQCGSDIGPAAVAALQPGRRSIRAPASSALLRIPARHPLMLGYRVLGCHGPQAGAGPPTVARGRDLSLSAPPPRLTG
jgi:hypothetical protein